MSFRLVFARRAGDRVFEDIELVEVIAVLHGAQDWSHLERR